MLKVPNQFQLLKVVQLFHHGEVPHRISTLDNHGRERIEKTQNNKPQTNMSTYHIYICLFPFKKNHNFPTQKTGAIPTRVFLLYLSEGFFDCEVPSFSFGQIPDYSA